MPYDNTKIALVVAAGGSAFIYQSYSHRINEQRQAISAIGNSHAFALQRQLEHAFSSTFALASLLQQGEGIENFDALAAEMVRSYGSISRLALAPNGVVRQIYPLVGHEEGIGLDLLHDPRRRTEALAAIQAKTLTLAGPYTLTRGMVGVIGRLPVFLLDDFGYERFWGFAIAIIDLPDLLAATRLNQLRDDGYDYELTRLHPDSNQRIVFARSSETDLQDPTAFTIQVPNGRWTLFVAATEGWQTSTSGIVRYPLGRSQ
jgi:hypothetical protein